MITGRRIITDRYTVDVPGDCSDSITELGDLAIHEAQERARLYCIPAEWEARHVSGEVGDFYVRFTVLRRRRFHG